MWRDNTTGARISLVLEGAPQRCPEIEGNWNVDLELTRSFARFEATQRRRRTWISVIAAIAYCRATVKALVPPNEVPAILGTSRNNAAAGVTGMLLGSFFQLLVEGERSVVEALYEKIEGENRHHRTTQRVNR